MFIVLVGIGYSTPWDHLIALKRRLAPSDSARALDIETKYHKLCKGPGKQDIEAWLEEWQLVCSEAISYKIGEAIGNRPLRDFLMAIHSKEPIFADSYLMDLEDDKPQDLDLLIENFRRLIRLHQSQKAKDNNTHSAFAAEKKGKERTI